MHEILGFSSRATLATKFLSSTQIDRYFPEIIKVHLKTCKSIKNRKSKLFTKPILSFIYIEKSKNLDRFLKKNRFEDFSKTLSSISVPNSEADWTIESLIERERWQTYLQTNRFVDRHHRFITYIINETFSKNKFKHFILSGNSWLQDFIAKWNI